MMFRPILVITLVILVLHEGNTGPVLAQCQAMNYRAWVKVGPYCAMYFQHQVPFNQAETRCRGQNRNGHLISIHDVETTKGVQILTRSEVWIGGMRMPQGGKFIWTDGSEWDYNNWVPGEPREQGNCVQINWHTPGKWDNAHCGEKRGFICAFKE